MARPVHRTPGEQRRTTSEHEQQPKASFHRASNDTDRDRLHASHAISHTEHAIAQIEQPTTQIERASRAFLMIACNDSRSRVST